MHSGHKLQFRPGLDATMEDGKIKMDGDLIARHLDAMARSDPRLLAEQLARSFLFPYNKKDEVFSFNDAIPPAVEVITLQDGGLLKPIAPGSPE